MFISPESNSFVFNTKYIEYIEYEETDGVEVFRVHMISGKDVFLTTVEFEAMDLPVKVV